MPDSSDYIKEVGEIIAALESLGFKPVLVGGMALVILGSRRITRDFDFVVSMPEDQIEELVAVFLSKGLGAGSASRQERRDHGHDQQSPSGHDSFAFGCALQRLFF